jgi:hypothetical protein
MCFVFISDQSLIFICSFPSNLCGDRETFRQLDKQFTAMPFKKKRNLFYLWGSPHAARRASKMSKAMPQWGIPRTEWKPSWGRGQSALSTSLNSAYGKRSRSKAHKALTAKFLQLPLVDGAASSLLSVFSLLEGSHSFAPTSWCCSFLVLFRFSFLLPPEPSDASSSFSPSERIRGFEIYSSDPFPPPFPLGLSQWLRLLALPPILFLLPMTHLVSLLLFCFPSSAAFL